MIINYGEDGLSPLDKRYRPKKKVTMMLLYKKNPNGRIVANGLDRRSTLVKAELARG